MRSTSVSEIHAYPLRPEGFEEPLFPTAASRREVAEHLLGAPWLVRACELASRGAGEVAHAFEEPVEVLRGGRTYVVRRECGRRRRSGRRVVEVLDRWREVGRWWEGDRYPDRTVFRVLLSGGAVVDLAREKGNEWLLVGVVD
ncbi:MAG TPA: hypothetical protein VK869_04240 [Rubrobacteraceae bacterium]|nr:hypothetical protein [Rubrobacteraceae bacterium]